MTPRLRDPKEAIELRQFEPALLQHPSPFLRGVGLLRSLACTSGSMAGGFPGPPDAGKARLGV